MGVLIAEWNRLDLTQLVSGGASDLSQGGATRTLSVVNVPERGNVLRYGGGAAGTTMTQIFMFSVASGLLIPSVDERRDVDIEMEVLTSVGGGGYLGCFFMGDLDTPLHGFGHLGSGVSSEWSMILRNGVVSTPGGTGGSATRAQTYHIRGQKPAGAPPQASSYMSGWDAAAGDTGEPRRSGASSAARGAVSPFGSDFVLGATWDDISADRIGIIARSSGGNPAPTFDLLSFKVIDPWA